MHTGPDEFLFIHLRIFRGRISVFSLLARSFNNNILSHNHIATEYGAQGGVTRLYIVGRCLSFNRMRPVSIWRGAGGNQFRIKAAEFDMSSRFFGLHSSLHHNRLRACVGRGARGLT